MYYVTVSEFVIIKLNLKQRPSETFFLQYPRFVAINLVMCARSSSDVRKTQCMADAIHFISGLSIYFFRFVKYL